MAGHQHLGYGAFQKISVQFRHTFEGGEETPETICFIFFISQSGILFCRKPENQRLGVVLVDWLLLQSIIQRLLRFGMCGWRIWQSNDVYFVVIYYAIPAYYPELELQIVFLSGFNANHLYKAKSRKAWIIHRCLAVSLYLQMCYFREWSLTGQPTNIADDEH